MEMLSRISRCFDKHLSLLHSRCERRINSLLVHSSTQIDADVSELTDLFLTTFHLLSMFGFTRQLNQLKQKVQKKRVSDSCVTNES